MDRAGQQTKS
jgi:hypothetical protein